MLFLDLENITTQGGQMQDDGLTPGSTPASQWQPNDNSSSDQSSVPDNSFSPPAEPMPEQSDPMPAPDTSTPADSTDFSPSSSMPTSTNDLLDIKTSALGQLNPLLTHLDQSPEEKFKTTMMMIQASDNQDLIKDAYEAAQKITDEKVKAQALLDIINEINYFTRQDSK